MIVVECYANVDPPNFGLPKDPEALHKISHYERDPKFHEFLKRFIDADPEIKTLRKWITHTLQS